jgi:hypothetical protein
MTDDELVSRLRRAAQTASEISRRMAEDKSLRQESNHERRTDLYMWATPEQTIEGQALARIETLAAEKARLEGALYEAVKRYPEAHNCLAWFAAASGLMTGEITPEAWEWAREALASSGISEGEG